MLRQSVLLLNCFSLSFSLFVVELFSDHHLGNLPQTPIILHVVVDGFGGTLDKVRFIVLHVFQRRTFANHLNMFTSWALTFEIQSFCKFRKVCPDSGALLDEPLVDAILEVC